MCPLGPPTFLNCFQCILIMFIPCLMINRHSKIRLIRGSCMDKSKVQFFRYFDSFATFYTRSKDNWNTQAINVLFFFLANYLLYFAIHMIIKKYLIRMSWVIRDFFQKLNNSSFKHTKIIFNIKPTYGNILETNDFGFAYRKKKSKNR